MIEIPPKFSDIKPPEPLSIPEEEPESPEVEEPRPKSRQNSGEVIDELLEEVVVDVGEEPVQKSVKDIAASFNKGNSP